MWLRKKDEEDEAVTARLRFSADLFLAFMLQFWPPQDIMPEGIPSHGSVPPEVRQSASDHLRQGEDALNATSGDSAPPEEARVDCSY